MLRLIPSRIIGILATIFGFLSAFAQGPVPVPVRMVTPKIIHTLPHDPGAFTQGLLYRNGFLYESTGLYGRSSLRKIEAATGKVLLHTRLPDSLFGEGIAFRKNRIWQLTWKEGLAQTYDSDDFSRKLTFRYQGEGWGLTTVGPHFFMSNGTDTLFVRDSLFRMVEKKPIRLNGKPLIYLNELEFARNRIFSNIWQSDEIAVIDPHSGRVTTLIDASGLGRTLPRRGPEDVLNGIAYNPETNHFYLTGKNWPLIFIVEIEGI